MPHNIPPCPDDLHLAPLSVQIDLDTNKDQIVPKSVELKRPGRIPDNYIPPLENNQFRRITEAVNGVGAQGICQKDGGLFATFASKEIAEKAYGKVKLVNNQKPNPIDSALVFGMAFLTLKRHDSAEELFRSAMKFIEGNQTQLFEEALTSLGPRRDADSWKWLGIIFYNLSAQYPNDPEYKRMALLAFTRALDLQPSYKKIETDMLVALLTVATELGELETAIKYVNKSSHLPERDFGPWFNMDLAGKGVGKYTRELNALNKLLLVEKDLHARHQINLLKSLIWQKAKAETKDDGPKGPAGQGTPGTPSGTPPSFPPASSTPGSNKASASSEEDATFSLGSFDIREEEPPPIPTTLPWGSAATFHRRRRSRGKTPASQITHGPTIPAYSPARPAGFTVNIPVGSACPLLP
jgi:tetratricopeptide (TPR) repeat protein